MINNGFQWYKQYIIRLWFIGFLNYYSYCINLHAVRFNQTKAAYFKQSQFLTIFS